MAVTKGVSTISNGTVIRGRISGDGDLQVQGRVEGSIESRGEVTIASGALIKSDVVGARLVVAGAVSGNLDGSELIVLEQGARVVGNLSAPTIGIRPGALVRGHVETGEGGSTRGARPARPAAKAQPIARASAAKPPPPSGAQRYQGPGAKAPAPRASERGPAKAPPPKGPQPKGKAAPPPPVLPALAKRTRKAAKRRAR
jgi:cytoskeletal protein CcmA (bactofilin family)